MPRLAEDLSAMPVWKRPGYVIRLEQWEIYEKDERGVRKRPVMPPIKHAIQLENHWFAVLPPINKETTIPKGTKVTVVEEDNWFDQDGRTTLIRLDIIEYKARNYRIIANYQGKTK
tara:strand:- start:336 stop:683 length:348 start_codon:yes stop_codon:yes gene_type:complete